MKHYYDPKRRAIQHWRSAGCISTISQISLGGYHGHPIIFLLGLLLSLLAGSGSPLALAQQPPAGAPAANGAERLPERALLDLLLPPHPVKLPDDAIIIPYDADDPAGTKNATKVLVPYAEYVKLWKRAFPDKPLTAEKLVTSYAIAGATYTTTLVGDEFLTVTGRMQIDCYTDDAVTIPLPLEDGVITQITLDGQPARVQIVRSDPAAVSAANSSSPPRANQAIPPAAPEMIMLQVAGKGRKSLEISLRFKMTRAGGWRLVQGRLPAATATAWDVIVPAAHTEVRLGRGQQPVNPGPQQAAVAAGATTQFQATIETQVDNETIRGAIAADGQFQLQWRPKVNDSQVDQSLTARSLAVLDVQEDGVRLTWQVTLAFGRGVRDSFVFTAPREFRVERVLGVNVRGWKSMAADAVQLIEVSLLRPATGQEVLTLLLSRRSAVGEGEMAAFDAPAVTVRDAALHQGMLVLRRGPLLDLRVENAEGLSRADADGEQVDAVLANVTEESPLGIRPFQTYRFAVSPFNLRLAATPYEAKTAVEVQALLKLGERESRYEARLVFTVENRPRYTVQCLLPAGLKVNAVEGPPGLEWTVTSGEGGEALVVFLPAGQQHFSLLVRGAFGKREAEVFAVPRLQVRDIDQQKGYVVVQADPAYKIEPETLRGCESVLLERVFPWLQAEQRQLARLALYYPAADYAASLRVIPRQPLVNVFTISNVRITPFAVEDTVYLQFGIQDAGIRQVVFRLPAAMRDARITVPLLRQKTIEPIADDPRYVRITLDLQDEVTQQLIVLIEHDRPLSDSSFEAPIPVVETGDTDQRFVVLESAGRDEVLVSVADELTELNRQQLSQWSMLTGILGDKITQAYSVRDDATNPRLAFQTRPRFAVETAGARIGLATTLLLVDGFGAFRGIQEYKVDNKTEQFLEIELPEDAELWTVRVAGESIKPTEVPGAASSRRVRVPLIKTAAGDLDYPVELKYGGWLPWLPLGGAGGKIRFPLMHTRNIHVEKSQVRLRLPDTHRWFDFGGTMRRVTNEGDLWAGYVSYNSKQIEQLLDVVRGDRDAFSKVRASNNLKQLGLALHNYHDTFRSFAANADLQRELTNNSMLWQQANEAVVQQTQQPAQEVASDNRSALSILCRTQELSRSKNVVTNLRGNFDASTAAEATKQGKPVSGFGGGEAQAFNLKWLEENRLQGRLPEQDARRAKDLWERLEQKPADSGLKGEGQASVSDEQGRAAANVLGKKLTVDAQAADATLKEAQSEVQESREISQRRAGELSQQVERYQLRLEQRQAAQAGDMPAQPTAPGMVGGAGMPQQPFAAPVQPQGERAAYPFGVNVPLATPTGPQAVTTLDATGIASQPDVSGIPGGQPAAVVLAGMKSLDIELPQRGVEYLFSTTRGEIAIEARAISTRQSDRWLELGGVVVALLLFAVAYCLGRALALRLGAQPS